MSWPVKSTPLRGHGGAIGAPALSNIAVLMDIPDEAWKLLAACRDVPDREIFFPSRGESPGPAKLICSGCPVRTECLEYALQHREKFGVWGGTSERERRRLRRLRRAS